MDSIDVLVVGAGVVGLAVARALAEAGREVIVIEAADAIGTGTSSRNSEVIHAGLYYPPGSLKARLCVEGNRLLYEYCKSRQVPHARTGKLIVAVETAQESRLADIEARASRNGAEALSWLSAAEARALEPEVRCCAALWSPASGIVDSHRYMLALQGDIEAAGGAVALRARLQGSEPHANGRVCFVDAGGQQSPLLARVVVNSAGLDAWEVARSLGLAPDAIPRRHLAKGHYFSLSGRSPFRHLVYPVPVPGGLGTHVTLDLAGGCRFGPDVAWTDSVDYGFEPGRKDSFVASIRRYWPELPAERLHEGYTGIRPKLVGPGEPDADFLIHGGVDDAGRGVIHLFGIESPGLTASLALGAHVAGRVSATGESSG